MQSILLTTGSDKESIVKRLEHLATLPPASRERLDRDQTQCKDSIWQQKPNEYLYLMQQASPPIACYRSLRQFYEQLAFAAGGRARYFTFLDASNNSDYTPPGIIVFNNTLGSSIRILRELQAEGKMPDAASCHVYYGAWNIVTGDAAMADALLQIPSKKDRSGSKTGSQQIILWDLTAETFNQAVHVLLQYQGEYLLPFRDESYQQLAQRTLTSQELKQMQAAKDAWL